MQSRTATPVFRQLMKLSVEATLPSDAALAICLPDAPQSFSASFSISVFRRWGFAAALGGSVVVLYHCCMSQRGAEVLAREGFGSDEFIAVTESPPFVDMEGAGGSHAVVMLGAPFDVNLNDYRAEANSQGVMEYLVPASVLNQFPRAVWPV